MRIPNLITLFVFMAICGAAFAQAPVARISLQRPRDTAGCAPHVITFVDASTGTVTTRQWTSSVGGNSTFSPWTTVFAQPGSYKVKLRVTNASGFSEDSITINVYGVPIVTFSTVDTTGCIPLTANFNAAGTTAGPNGGSITSLEWIYGDGSRDTVTNGLFTASHTYTSGGNFTPVLRVTNSRGCSQFFPQTSGGSGRIIRVGNGVVTSFRDSSVLVCVAPLPVLFSNTSSGDLANTNFFWDFGDGSPVQQINNTSPFGVSHNYASSGIYPVKVLSVSSNGCRDSSIRSISVTGFETKIIGDTDVCVRRTLPYTFTSNTTPRNFAWSISPAVSGFPVTGRAQNIRFTAPGTYTLSLYIDYGSCDTTLTKTITVKASPIVTFTASDSVSCTRPFTTSFTTTTPGVAYQWRFGAGASPAGSTAQNPSGITYPNLGNSTVTLIVSNGDGCVDSLVRTNYIRVDSARASLAATPRLCSGPNGFTPNYNASSSPDGIKEYRLTFQQLTPTLGPIVSVTRLPNQPAPNFPTPVAGTYRITLVVESVKGCISGEISRVLTVGDQVTAVISKTKNELCVDESVNFSVNQPAAPTTTFRWNFGPASLPGTTTLRIPPPVRYSTSGIKPISLLITTNNCETTLVDSVIVKPPTADFRDSLIDCAGSRTLFGFKNTSLGQTDVNSNTYQWVFGYNVNTPTGIASSTTLNGGPQDFGTVAPGVYTVWLKATDASSPPNGCSDTVIRSISIIPQGSISLNKSATSICKGETITFSTVQPFSGAIEGYTWRITNNATTIYSVNNSLFSTRTIRMPNTGTWRVTLTTTDRNGCVNTFVDSGTVKGMRAGFSISPGKGCTNQAQNFIDTSIVTQPGGSIVSRRWLFGDGGTNVGNSATVAYAYPAEGTYSVRLLLQDSDGCLDSVTRPNSVIIGDAKAGFTSVDSLSCPNQQVRFTDTSYGNLERWKWYFSFGNNNALIDSASNPVFRYGINDTTIKHTIKLVVTAASGCMDSIVKSQYITIKQPKAAFSPVDTSSKCPPLVMDYRDSSYYGRTWSWNFDDLGAVSNDTSASHTFLIPRTYNVSLVVTSPGGCTDTAKGTVQVDGPFGQLTYGPPLLACDSLRLTNLKVNARLAVAYVWLYGDGQSDFTTSDTIRSHTYRWDSASNGKFVPTVILYDTTYYTDFNNRCGVPLIGSYTGVDTFNINKLDDTLTVERTVPYSFANRNLLCDSGTVVFRDSTITNAVGLIHEWNFGDGSQVSNDVSPSHFYAAPGVYTVRHKVISLSAAACEDSAQTVTIRVVASPQAVILLPSGDSLCRPAPFQFAGSRQTPDTSNIALWSWDWKFGNGAGSNVQNPPVQLFPNSGVFGDTLVVRNASGCVDTAFRSVFVPSDNDLIVGFTRSLPVICDTGTVQFTDTSIVNVGGIRSYSWSFGDNATSALQNPRHFYGTPGLYDVKLVLSTTKNCIDSFTAPIRVIRRSDSLQLAFSATPRQLCDSGTTQFTDNSLIRIPGSFTYQWTFGDNTTADTRQNPDHKYTALGAYNVTLRILASQPSCSDSLTQASFIKVVGKPVPVINIQPNDSLCFPALFVFSGTNTDTSTVVNWQWTLGNGNSFTGINPPPQAFNTVGSFVNTLVATNATGCTQTITRSSTVMPLPVMSVNADTVICRGGTASLTATGANAYTWSPLGTLTAPNSASTQASPSLNQTYIVTGTTSFGCQADTFVTVKVFQPYQLGVTQDADTICGNSSTQITAFGAPEYLWTPPLGLSNAAIANPIALPDVTTLYTVTGFDSLGCFTQTKTVDVRKFALPLVTLPGSVIVNAGTTYTMAPTVSPDVIRYQWSPSAGLSSANIANPVLNATANQRYVLTVTNDGECQSRDTIEVLVTCNNGNVYIPNTFSPNNDGINDRFTPRGTGLTNVRSMRIFNRWGRMVFEKRNLGANNLNDGWDGRIDGKEPQSDAYVYMLEIVCSTGQILKYTGTITLVN